jgi:hypothetical protein
VWWVVIVQEAFSLVKDGRVIAHALDLSPTFVPKVETARYRGRVLDRMVKNYMHTNVIRRML